MSFFKRELTIHQIFGSGLALILIALALSIYYNKILYTEIALGLVILLMIWPKPFKYFGYFWFAFGEGLGYIVSRVILSVVFVILVVPVGLLKRKQIRSNMQVHAFKNSTSSLFKNRNYLFSEKDFEKPF